MQSPFLTRLQSAWRLFDSMLCVGLDPEPTRLPVSLRDRPDAVFQLCRAIVDATAPFACAFKPQIAYFHAVGAENQLEQLTRHIRLNHPQHLLVLDAKRGDIGSTAQQYAREVFERYQADVVTLSPYLGFDSIEPYLAYPDRGVFVLCRTSNPGGADLQGLLVQTDGGQLLPLYEQVAELAARRWNQNGQIGLVVGATYPQELARVRQRVGTMPLLVPGIGAQGGDIEATVLAGGDDEGYGMLVSSSRAIIYAGSGDDFAEQAAAAAQSTRDALRRAARLSSQRARAGPMKSAQ